MVKIYTDFGQQKKNIPGWQAGHSVKPVESFPYVPAGHSEHCTHPGSLFIEEKRKFIIEMFNICMHELSQRRPKNMVINVLFLKHHHIRSNAATSIYFIGILNRELNSSLNTKIMLFLFAKPGCHIIFKNFF